MFHNISPNMFRSCALLCYKIKFIELHFFNSLYHGVNMVQLHEGYGVKGCGSRRGGEGRAQDVKA